ncbi:unnamed protein product [Orchesella dallaii]|uniref:Ig-like domain-containing protein n=1 Tax=Orchesella dallaii TaxID=48710 RepID=A0ABP1QW46_9HEXA
MIYKDRLFFIKLEEPLGGTSPRFSGNAQVLSGFIHDGGSSFALLCPAQAYPPPSYTLHEPLGGTAPRFSSQAHLQAFNKEQGTAFALHCPAQAYPPPLYMYVLSSISKLVISTFIDHIPSFALKIEPMGSSVPNLPYDSRLQAMIRSSGSSIAITCLAQGSPVPRFRANGKRSSQSSIKRSFTSYGGLCRILNSYDLSCTRKPCSIFQSPKLVSDQEHETKTLWALEYLLIKRKQFLYCVMHKVILLHHFEPLSGVAPKSPELVRPHRTVSRNEPAVLTCEAQGNPPPKFL